MYINKILLKYYKYCKEINNNPSERNKLHDLNTVITLESRDVNVGVSEAKRAFILENVTVCKGVMWERGVQIRKRCSQN